MFTCLAAFLAILLVVLANPIPELSDDLTTTGQLFSNEQNPDTALFNPDENDEAEDKHTDSMPEFSQNLLSDSTADEPSLLWTPGTECTSAASASDILDQSIQQRSVLSRQLNACPSGFLLRPPGSRNGNLPNGRSSQPHGNGKTRSYRDSGNRDPEKPCARDKDSRHVHVTCKGPAIGSSIENADHVLDCVPNGQTSIPERHLFKYAENVAQFCCHDFTDEEDWYPGHSCTKITFSEAKPLTLWSRSYFQDTITGYVDALETRTRIMGEPWKPPF